MNDDKIKQSSFVDHLTELRKRLINSFIFLFVFFISQPSFGADQTIEMLNKLDKEFMVYSQKIVSIEVGDTLSYQIYAEDVTGRGNSGNIGSYVRVSSPIATQKTLLIQDGTIDTIGLYNSGTGLNSVLQGSEFTRYYIWNVADRDGIDSSVVNHSTFNTIVKYGWGGSTMAAKGTDVNGYAEFLNRGGRLLYSDMDYFFAAGLPASGSFNAGDFAYDYLGLASYVNDPDNDGDASNGGYGDVQMTGVTGNAITNDWVSSPYIIDFESIGWPNWGDFQTARSDGNAEKIFTGNTSFEATGISNYDLGTKAPYKTVYFGFPIEAGSGSNWADFTNLLTDTHRWPFNCSNSGYAFQRFNDHDYGCQCWYRITIIFS